MNSVLESSYAWTGQFVEAINRLTCDVASLIFSSLSITSNTSGSSNSEASSSGESPVAVATSASGEAVLSVPCFLDEVASLFVFDDFQLVLLKIFIAILISNVCLIYIAWHVYGEKITERFMSPNNSTEELQKNIAKLKLPKEHSQRHS